MLSLLSSPLHHHPHHHHQPPNPRSNFIQNGTLHLSGIVSWGMIPCGQANNKKQNPLSYIVHMLFTTNYNKKQNNKLQKMIPCGQAKIAHTLLQHQETNMTNKQITTNDPIRPSNKLQQETRHFFVTTRNKILPTNIRIQILGLKSQ